MLDLSYNALHKVENRTTGLFDPLLSIKVLNVSHNNLSNVGEYTFSHHKWIPYKLKEVDLSYNSLPVVTEDFLLGMQHVQKLNLSHNLLNEIRKGEHRFCKYDLVFPLLLTINDIYGGFFLGVFPKLTQLKVLDLSSNELTHLPNNTISSAEMANLVELRIAGNLLSAIPAVEMASMPNLTMLDLRDNRLSKIHEPLYGKIKTGATIMYKGTIFGCKKKKDNFLHCFYIL